MGRSPAGNIPTLYYRSTLILVGVYALWTSQGAHSSNITSICCRNLTHGHRQFTLNNHFPTLAYLSFSLKDLIKSVWPYSGYKNITGHTRAPPSSMCTRPPEGCGPCSLSKFKGPSFASPWRLTKLASARRTPRHCRGHPCIHVTVT